jgi:hypothetical protein
MQLPRVDKVPALDIMSWNNSWGDDMFASEEMTAAMVEQLERRRSETV